MLEILLASNNRGKIREYKDLLAGLPYRLLSPDEAGIILEVSETGASFEENAIAKAKAYMAISHIPTLADDSGLEVDALNGEPGIYSARYAGNNATDAERISYLLSRMEGISWDKRIARFYCVIALSFPGGRLEFFHGECKGIIALEPKGSYGFGYDPVFYLPDMGKTMAEIPKEIKNQISHRSRAAQKARRFLKQWAREEILK